MALIDTAPTSSIRLPVSPLRGDQHALSFAAIPHSALPLTSVSATCLGSCHHAGSGQALDHGSQIDYRIEIEPASWIPSSLGINFLQHELAEQFNALGKEMLRRK